MSDVPLLGPAPSFAAFYRAVNRREPFPWQARLADEVARTEKWPAEIGVPTGLGKTACLDVAVWWLASQADRTPRRRTAPTRIWWVVNRRLLVDSTFEHAKTIGQALCHPSAEGRTRQSTTALEAVSERLRALSVDSSRAPLEVIRLRGGVASRRPTDPSRPAVMLSTLPMYGSRLLFRGYGSTRSMRPIDAALAGADSLVLLDEAHLAPHLRALVPALADCTPGSRAILGDVRSRPTIVALTATGDADGADGDRFDLDRDDEANSVVRQRLDAAKPMELRVVEDGADAGRLLAEAALGLIGRAPAPAACIVFANTPAAARAAFLRLRKEVTDKSAEVLLLTGWAREREAEHARERILDPVHGMASGRNSKLGRERHLIVVATQTLEVGADIDAEYLVTEACGVRALTQRLGRLNRLGDHAYARAVYVHAPPKPPARRGKKSGSDSSGWPVYGSEPEIVLQRLKAARSGDAMEPVNLSPRRVARVLGSPSEVHRRAPQILPGLLWEWTKTTTRPDGEAPVEPYFSGIAGPEYSVSLIWRADIPDSGKLLWPRASNHEIVEIPIHEARDALSENETLHRLRFDGVTVEEVSTADLRPGDSLILPCDRGLLDEFGWNPDAASSIVDVSILKHGLPLNAAAIQRLCGLTAGRHIDKALGVGGDDEDVDQAEKDEALEQILTALAESPPQGWDRTEWNDLLFSLDRQIVTSRNETPRLQRRKADLEPHSNDFDETSLAETAVVLNLHCQAVAARARAIADRLGVASDLAEIVEEAGLLHDIGKADRRFQRWLDPDGRHGGVLVAKSNLPRHRWNAVRSIAGWPKGGRHESLSARLAQRWEERAAKHCDLLLHLIVSHHGSGRPLVPPAPDGTSDTVSGAIEDTAVEAPADLEIVDWTQPRRFRRLNDKYGPWGLALLEAVVRQADHAVSAGRSEVY